MQLFVGFCKLPARLMLGPDDVDVALEVGAVFDGDAGGGQVTGQGAGFLKFDDFGGFDVAVNVADDHDFFCLEIGYNLGVGSYGDR